jgi:hypothetical protein
VEVPRRRLNISDVTDIDASANPQLLRPISGLDPIIVNA